jgi:hypothetical protein
MSPRDWRRPARQSCTILRPDLISLNHQLSWPVTLGGPYTRQIALDKGDARESRIVFTTQTRSCSFQADLLVYSKGKQYRLRLPSSWGADGKPASYTFTVAPPHKPYKSHYVVGTGNMLEHAGRRAGHGHQVDRPDAQVHRQRRTQLLVGRCLFLPPLHGDITPANVWSSQPAGASSTSHTMRT